MGEKRRSKSPMPPREARRFQRDFIARIAPDCHFQIALNHLANTCVIVKNAEGRFVWVSDNLALRLGYPNPSDMIGLDDFDINPRRLAINYRRDDLEVLQSGKPLLGKVELAYDPLGKLDWNVTNKHPLCDARGKVIGLIATIQAYRGMRDLPLFGGELRTVAEYIFTHLDSPLRTPQLAAIAGVSCRQIDRRFLNATGMNPTDFIIRARLDEACRRLRDTDDPIGKIAVEVGFYDHSAMTRLFRRCLGTTPTEFRRTRLRRQ